MICEAIRTLKADIGSEVVISGILPGPYTLLLYLIDLGGLFVEMKREPAAVQEALSQLSMFLSQVGAAYRSAGADFITVHEMGGSPGFIGPAKFEQFVFPAVKQLVGDLPKPVVLSVCGNTNKSMHLLASRRPGNFGGSDQRSCIIPCPGRNMSIWQCGSCCRLQQGGEAEILEAVHRAKRRVWTPSGPAVTWSSKLLPETSIL